MVATSTPDSVTESPLQLSLDATSHSSNISQSESRLADFGSGEAPSVPSQGGDEPSRTNPSTAPHGPLTYPRTMPLPRQITIPVASQNLSRVTAVTHMRETPTFRGARLGELLPSQDLLKPKLHPAIRQPPTRTLYRGLRPLWMLKALPHTPVSHHFSQLLYY